MLEFLEVRLDLFRVQPPQTFLRSQAAQALLGSQPPQAFLRREVFEHVFRRSLVEHRLLFFRRQAVQKLLA